MPGFKRYPIPREEKDGLEYTLKVIRYLTGEWLSNPTVFGQWAGGCYMEKLHELARESLYKHGSIEPEENERTRECSRCKAPFKYSAVDGNCQAENLYEFHLAGKSPQSGPSTILHGMCGPWGWSGRLCDNCLIAVRDFLKGDAK
jgi:hypothetical protein